MSGSDSIFVDQDWTRTEKFLSPLICALLTKLTMSHAHGHNAGGQGSIVENHPPNFRKSDVIDYVTLTSWAADYVTCQFP